MGGVLSDSDIGSAITSGDLHFAPALESEQIQGASVDLRLGRLAQKTAPNLHTVNLSEGSPTLEIAPQEFVQFITHETIKLSDRLSARIGVLSRHTRQGERVVTEVT